jgi:RecA/RadA recombinase
MTCRVNRLRLLSGSDELKLSMSTVTIYVDGVDKTSQISDWTIRWDERQKQLMLTCHFPSGKLYLRPLNVCTIEPTEAVESSLLTKKGSSVFHGIESAVVYGQKYIVVKYASGEKLYPMKLEGVFLTPKSNIKEGDIFNYFVSVASARIEKASSNEKSITENVLDQLRRITPHPETALHAYCIGDNAKRESEDVFIYPFGVNVSQLSAVERAFSSQISLIEGPPGTGKTQTILNIIANIVLRGKTVAIVSNNNSAVSNVYEKLDKAGLGYLVAKLGSFENRKDFFDTAPTIPPDPPLDTPIMPHIQTVLQKVQALLHAHNEIAQLKADIYELQIEQRYLLQWHQENSMTDAAALKTIKLSAKKSIQLMAYLSHLSDKRISLKDRFNLFFHFKILRATSLNNLTNRLSLLHSLQMDFYAKTLEAKNATLLAYQYKLEQASFKDLMKELTESSMAYLKKYIYTHITDMDEFDEKSYRKNFDAFLKRYPIIGSGTHSIINSIDQNAILDYVIIDEASQQDIVPGVLALGCARNLVIVGDKKQLPHIPSNLGIASPAQYYDCDKYSLLDSCLEVFKGSLTKTLLKEHYRCHPKIIGFCNKQFYENQLVVMTEHTNEKPLTLVVTAKGNHTRGYSNLRELDSANAILQLDNEIHYDDQHDRGFLAPYRAQINLAEKNLPSDFIKTTVHKFQGRECAEIIFSTVLDKKNSSQKRLSFVDDPHLINVAVSRAKSKFTLITGDDVFSEKYGYINALIRYIKYYAEDGQIYQAPVISAFDRLYSEYDESLNQLNARLRPRDSRYKSEQIVTQVLRETLLENLYKPITFHTQIFLMQLVSASNNELTSREKEFMKNGSSCDFVVYFKLGKVPAGVIEVDGGSHNTPQQIERDLLKDSILKKSKIPLLRLQTIESHIQEKIFAFFAQILAGDNAQINNG